jgi:hypothetical protein
VIPRWLIESSPGYLAEVTAIPVPLGGRCHLRDRPRP